MKKTLFSFFFFCILCVAQVAYALEVTQAPTLKSNSNTSVTIQWDEVEGAIGYFVYYDTSSGETGGYDNQGIDLIEETSHTIEDLESGTDYFVAITVVDINGEESFFSPETIVNTSGANGTEAFALTLVEATGPKELTLTFNAPLEDSDTAEREFLIMNSITEEELIVVSDGLDDEDSSQLIVNVDQDLILGDNYDFTILSIIDADGRNIESGIDALTNFQVPDSFAETPVEEPVEEVPVVVETPVEETPEETPVEEPEEELTSAGPEVTITNEQTQEEESIPDLEENEGGNSGVKLSSEDIEKTTESEAKKTEKLPKTGPEHVILILLAFLIGLGVFVYISNKQKV